MSDCTELRLRERGCGLGSEGHEGMRKVGTA